MQPENPSLAPAQQWVAPLTDNTVATPTSTARLMPSNHLFWPLLVILLALTVGFSNSAYQHWFEYQIISASKLSLDGPEQNAKKIRAAVDAIAAATAKLADGGNESAKVVVEGLRKRGITINPAAPASTK